MKDFRQFLTEAMGVKGINRQPYTKGRCAVFALAMHQELGYQLGVVWDTNPDWERDYMSMGDRDDAAWAAHHAEHGDELQGDEDMSAVIHVFCYKTPNVLVDVRGRMSENEMLDWAAGGDPKIPEDDLRIIDVTVDEVHSFMKPNSPSNLHGGMLSPKPGEIEELQRYIRAHEGRF